MPLETKPLKISTSASSNPATSSSSSVPKYAKDNNSFAILLIILALLSSLFIFVVVPIVLSLIFSKDYNSTKNAYAFRAFNSPNNLIAHKTTIKTTPVARERDLALHHTYHTREPDALIEGLQPTHTHIVIIGSGLAGVAAAVAAVNTAQQVLAQEKVLAGLVKAQKAQLVKQSKGYVQMVDKQQAEIQQMIKNCRAEMQMWEKAGVAANQTATLSSTAANTSTRNDSNSNSIPPQQLQQPSCPLNISAASALMSPIPFPSILDFINVSIHQAYQKLQVSAKTSPIYDQEVDALANQIITAYSHHTMWSTKKEALPRIHVSILEKSAILGGNSMKASSGINGVLPDKKDSHDELSAQVDAFFKDTMMSGTINKPKLVETLTAKSTTALTWLKALLPSVNWASQPVLMGGHSKPRTWTVSKSSTKPIGASIMSAFQPILQAFIKKKLLSLVYNVKVTDIQVMSPSQQKTALPLYKLTIDELYPPTLSKKGSPVPNKKTGLLKKSHTLYANAVILATGGYAANTKLMQQAGLTSRVASLPSTNGPSASGDAIPIAHALGAHVENLFSVQIHPTAFVDPAFPSAPTKFLCPEMFRGRGGLLLDLKGRRFVNELDTRDKVTLAIARHAKPITTLYKADDAHRPPSFVQAAIDSLPKKEKMRATAALQDIHKVAKFATWKVAFLFMTEQMIKANSDSVVQFYVSKRLLTVYNSLQEAVRATGMSESDVQASFESYYQIASSSSSTLTTTTTATTSTAPTTVADVFGKKLFPAWESVRWNQTGKVYVALITPAIHYTHGGISIDANAQVLTYEPNPLAWYDDLDAALVSHRPVGGKGNDDDDDDDDDDEKAHALCKFDQDSHYKRENFDIDLDEISDDDFEADADDTAVTEEQSTTFQHQADTQVSSENDSDEGTAPSDPDMSSEDATVDDQSSDGNDDESASATKVEDTDSRTPDGQKQDDNNTRTSTSDVEPSGGPTPAAETDDQIPSKTIQGSKSPGAIVAAQVDQDSDVPTSNSATQCAIMGEKRIRQKKMSTEIKPRTIRGLFAAGEVTSGVHGLNRLGGNSLLECVVFGRIAGQQSVKYVRQGQQRS